MVKGVKRIDILSLILISVVFIILIYFIALYLGFDASILFAPVVLLDDDFDTGQTAGQPPANYLIPSGLSGGNSVLVADDISFSSPNSVRVVSDGTFSRDGIVSVWVRSPDLGPGIPLDHQLRFSSMARGESLSSNGQIRIVVECTVFNPTLVPPEIENFNNYTLITFDTGNPTWAPYIDNWLPLNLPAFVPATVCGVHPTLGTFDGINILYEIKGTGTGTQGCIYDGTVGKTGTCTDIIDPITCDAAAATFGLACSTANPTCTGTQTTIDCNLLNTYPDPVGACNLFSPYCTIGPGGCENVGAGMPSDCSLYNNGQCTGLESYGCTWNVCTGTATCASANGATPTTITGCSTLKDTPNVEMACAWDIDGPVGSFLIDDLALTDIDCGNGVIRSGEQCDDGPVKGLANGDGCSTTCQIESGWACTGEPSVCTLIPPTQTCGNNIKEGTEICDGTDLGTPARTCVNEGFTGGTLSCATNCLSFVTSSCTLCGDNKCEAGEDSTNCPADCEPPASTCGDAAGVCDGNEICGDVDSDPICNTDCGACPVTPECGNGEPPENGEECEPPLPDSGYCRAIYGASRVVCNIQCLCEAAAPGTPICGNDLVEAGEQCDDGDNSGGDGCSNTCQIESGYECTNDEPSDCNLIPVCDNGAITVGTGSCTGFNTITDCSYIDTSPTIANPEVTCNNFAPFCTWTGSSCTGTIPSSCTLFDSDQCVSLSFERGECTWNLPIVEVCDGTLLGGETCLTQGFDGGDLACATNCLDYDTSACTTATTQCSDGIDNDGDGKCDLATSTCTDESTPGDVGCVNAADDDENNCGDGLCSPGESCSADNSACAINANGPGGLCIASSFCTNGCVDVFSYPGSTDSLPAPGCGGSVGCVSGINCVCNGAGSCVGDASLCDGDGICEPGQGEDINNCISDCYIRAYTDSTWTCQVGGNTVPASYEPLDDQCYSSLVRKSEAYSDCLLQGGTVTGGLNSIFDPVDDCSNTKPELDPNDPLFNYQGVCSDTDNLLVPPFERNYYEKGTVRIGELEDDEECALDGHNLYEYWCSSGYAVWEVFDCASVGDVCVDGACISDCGNGFKTGNEFCDDGDNDDGDGCSATCGIEAGWTCTGGITEPSVCTPSATCNAASCPDTECYEPICTDDACDVWPIPNGGHDESCLAPSYCNGAGTCVTPEPPGGTLKFCPVNAVLGIDVEVPVTVLREGAGGIVYYCDLDLEFKVVKSLGESCTGGDFECASNLCLDGVCTSVAEELDYQGGLLVNIWCFLTNLGDDTGFDACVASFA